MKLGPGRVRSDRWSSLRPRTPSVGETADYHLPEEALVEQVTVADSNRLGHKQFRVEGSMSTTAKYSPTGPGSTCSQATGSVVSLRFMVSGRVPIRGSKAKTRNGLSRRLLYLRIDRTFQHNSFRRRKLFWDAYLRSYNARAASQSFS